MKTDRRGFLKRFGAIVVGGVGATMMPESKPVDAAVTPPPEPLPNGVVGINQYHVEPGEISAFSTNVMSYGVFMGSGW